MSTLYTLANDVLCLECDENGRMLSLTNRVTGHDYLGAGTRIPWRMFYRQGDAIDLEIAAEDQQGQVSVEGSRLTITYERLTGRGARLYGPQAVPVRFCLTAELVDDALVWTAEVESHAEGIEITELWLPWLYGIGHLGHGRPADVLYWPERGGRRIVDPYARLAATWAHLGDPNSVEPSWYRLTYPFPASMSWFTLNNGEEGVYIGAHDTSLMSKCLSVMAHRDGALSAAVILYPFVKAGEVWASPPTVVRLYRGDWHQAARTYRAWADTWMKPPAPPAWIRRAPGWVKVFGKSQHGHIRQVYSDFPKQLKRSQAVGMNVLHCFGWVTQGFDNRYPHYSPDEVMGGEEGLKQALAEVKAEGGHMILYTQGQLIDPTTEFYQGGQGKRTVVRDIWGYEYREQYAQFAEGTLLSQWRNKWFGVACPLAPGWIDRLASQFDMVSALGAQGILYDQMGGMPPYICFSDEHDHEKPSLAVGPGKVRNMRRLRDLIKGQDPDFAFVIELVTDCYCEYVDIIHAHGIGFCPGPESFGELFRYTFPEPVITNRADVQQERQKHLGFAFSLGLRFDASIRDDVDRPEVAAYLMRLCELRNSYPELLLEGRFVDNEGFVCDNSLISTHGFLAGDRLAVTVWNPTERAQPLRVVAPGYELVEVAWQNPAFQGTGHLLPAGDVAVLIWQK